MNDATLIAPPKDRAIVVIGRVIWSDGEETDVMPFADAVIWQKESYGGAHEAWHYYFPSYNGRLSVARSLEQEVKIDFWTELPTAQS